MAENTFKRFVLPLGWIVPLVVALLGVPFLIWGEQFRVAYGAIALLIASHWVVILWLVWFAFEKSGKFTDLPVVIIFERSIGCLISESRSWMGIGVAVSVYQRVGKIERLLCHGFVENIQADMSTQVRLVPLEENGASSLFDKMELVNRKELLLKPGQLLRNF